MFINFLRKNVYASYALLALRLYVGYQWMTAGWGKVTGGFDASGFLKGAVGKAVGDHPAVQTWWADFLSAIALPNAGFFSFLVAWGELLVGIGLILGCFTTLAALMAVVMNSAFLLSGTTSTNPQLLLLAMFIVVASTNAGRIGADRYVLPYLKSIIFKNKAELKVNAAVQK